MDYPQQQGCIKLYAPKGSHPTIKAFLQGTSVRTEGSYPYELPFLEWLVSAALLLRHYNGFIIACQGICEGYNDGSFFVVWFNFD